MRKLILILSIVLLGNVAFACKFIDYDTLTSNKLAAVKGANSDTAGLQQYPEFPGGQSAVIKFVADNTKYPKKARKKGIKGRVILKFIIDKDGSVTNAEVVRGIGGGCDEEALRVVNAMPKWKPGYHDGKPVKVYYTLPITFNLQD